MLGAMANNAIDDARKLFDGYVDLTRKMVRAVPEGTYFRYPPLENQQDMMVFAAIFTNVWQAIQKDFKPYYDGKPRAFDELKKLAIPNSGSQHNAFWKQDGATLKPFPVSSEEGVRTLCRTLRNGFNHFNYRYVDLTPDEYFARLTVPTPSGLLHASTRSNYRIFICDHGAGTPANPLKLMDLGSKSRVLETGFAHLRFHLYEFLSHFFEATGGRKYTQLFNLVDS
jgi:hypothetical protein